MKRGYATDGRTILRSSSGLQIRLGNLGAAVCLLCSVVLLAGLSAGIGVTDTDLRDFILHLSGAHLDDSSAYALWSVRLPRIAMAFMAGWSVALAGAILQSLARNPLADPGLFGFSQGSITAIMLLLVFIPAASKGLMAAAAIAGGFGVALLLIWLVGGAHSSGLAILLMGIAIETVLSSFSSFLLLYAPPETSLALSEWIAGSLFQANWQTIAFFLPIVLLSLCGIFLMGSTLSVYDLGNDMAMAVGEAVSRSRPLLLLFAVFMSAAAVIAVGPLTFLGVMAPHLAGFLSKSTGRARLFLSAFMGGTLVVAADALTRAMPGDLTIPVGLSLTLIGVPLFIIILRLQALRRLQAH